MCSLCWIVAPCLSMQGLVACPYVIINTGWQWPRVFPAHVPAKPANHPSVAYSPDKSARGEKLCESEHRMYNAWSHTNIVCHMSIPFLYKLMRTVCYFWNTSTSFLSHLGFWIFWDRSKSCLSQNSQQKIKNTLQLGNHSIELTHFLESQIDDGTFGHLCQSTVAQLAAVLFCLWEQCSPRAALCS